MRSSGWMVTILKRRNETYIRIRLYNLILHDKFNCMSKTMLFQDLDAVFKHLQDGKAYREYCKKRVAKIILPNSVIRVFTAGTKQAIFDCLQKIDVNELPALKTKELFDSWHKTQLGKVSKSISGFGNNLAEIGEEGIRYGHAAKILNLFLGHLVFSVHIFLLLPVKRSGIFCTFHLIRKYSFCFDLAISKMCLNQ